MERQRNSAKTTKSVVVYQGVYYSQRNGNAAYQRHSQAICIRTQLETLCCRDVYNDMLQDDLVSAAQDLQQMWHAKHKVRCPRHQNQNNVADDVLEVIRMMTMPPCVRKASHRKGVERTDSRSRTPTNCWQIWNGSTDPTSTEVCDWWWSSTAPSTSDHVSWPSSSTLLLGFCYY